MDKSDCPDGYFCFWGDSEFRGRWFAARVPIPNVGIAHNDQASSYWNRTGQTWCLYIHENYRDRMDTVPPGKEKNYMIGANDDLTSLKPC
ncbi:peptidase inhibitor family I36 protein [Nonomuraea lactucae]|uniref:peptidase inhibitor family I36 protein n=1 Tax=Nonomuraea lactucae TaxID=2249762 RepID=UPI003B8330D8